MEKKKNNNSSSIENYIEMGKFYFLNGRYDEAIEEFKKALKIDPTNYEVYYNLGIAYETINNLDEAVKMYQRVLEINPEHKLSKQHLQKIINFK